MNDLNALRDRLRECCAQVAIELLGYAPNPRLSNAAELRFGAKGSFSLDLSWDKRGLWYDFEGGCGGDMFDLIMHHYCCGFAEAIRWAAGFLGFSELGPSQPARVRPRLPKPDPLEARRRDDQRIKHALAIWLRSQPIERTPAETYLVRHRGICFPDGADESNMLPFNLRFDPVEHALVFPVTDETNALVGVQSVYLDEAGRKRQIEVPKRSRGSIGLGMIRFFGDDHRREIVLAEGPETGLSIAVATGFEVACASGSTYRKHAGSVERPIIIAVDDDERDAQTHHQRRHQIKLWRDAGYTVNEIFPFPDRREKGGDFNDLAQSAGLYSVRDRIASALPRPAPSAQLCGLGEARRQLTQHVENFFRDRPKLVVLHVDLGVGKTTTVLQAAHRTLTQLRAQGDSRTIVLAVPEARLGDESARTFNALGAGLRAHVWRGRAAVDPGRPDDLMCRNYTEVQPVLDALGSVPIRVCGTCKFAAACAYEAQKQLTPDLWIVAHTVLFLDHPPEAITGAGLHSLIIDESPCQAGLIGCDDDLSIDRAALTRLPIAGLDTVFRNILFDGRSDLAAVLRDHAPGYLTKDALARARFDAGRARELASLEEARRLARDFGLMPLDKLARRHWKLVPMLLVWNEVARLFDSEESASGRLEVALEEGRNVLKISGRKDIGEKFKAPTMIADATYDPELVCWYFPRLPDPIRISVKAPHQRIIQVTDRAFSKRMLLPAKTDTRVDRDRKDHYKSCIRAIAYEKALGGKVLLVSNKSVVEWLGPILGVQTAHFNAVAGRDAWGDVRHLIVIGSPQPPPRTVEHMAAALTGRPVQHVVDWFGTRDGSRLVDGMLVTADAQFHPDATANAVLKRITSGEVQQALGRARGVKRTRNDPVDVLCLTHVILPQEIAEMISGYRFLNRPNPITEQLSEQGVALLNSEDAQNVHGMWKSSAALRKALQRSDLPIDLNAALPETSHLGIYRYRKAGPRTRRLFCVVDRRVISDPENWVRERLDLAEWEDVTSLTADFV